MTQGELLLTNDDGVTDLLAFTFSSLRPAFECIRVVVPEHNQSGAGSAITVDQPIHVRRLRDGQLADTLLVRGTPCDGIRYALRHEMWRPNVVVSGMNDGWNLGLSVLNSGTVGAAAVGAGFGLGAVAVSAPAGQALTDPSWNHTTSRVLRHVTRCVAREPGSFTVLNLNLPIEYHDAPSVRVVDVSRAQYEEWYEEVEIASGHTRKLILRSSRLQPGHDATDLDLLGEGHAVASVIATPWQLDTTALTERLARLDAWTEP